MKTARFTTIVEKAGAPTPHTLWLDPSRDRILQRAIKENRVMSVHQTATGTAKDFGTIGYIKDRQSFILVFPKSLRRFSDRKVVGINYDLLAEEKPAPAPKQKRAKAKAKTKKQKPRRPSPPEPKLKPAGRQRTEPKSKAKVATPKPPPPRERPKPKSNPAPRKKVTTRKTPTVARTKPKPAASTDIPPETLKVIRRAVSDLKTGNSVAAYDRLRALLS